MRITTETMPAFEALQYVPSYSRKLMVEKANGQAQHYVFQVTKDGTIKSRYGVLTVAKVTWIDGKNPLPVFFGWTEFDPNGNNYLSFEV